MSEENQKADGQKTILVIDDETSLVNLIRLHLTKRGFKVIGAQDGIEGLKLAAKFSPDLIILDINMPRKSGIEFYHDILTEHGRPKYPVLVLTAREELRSVFDSIDADGFLGKPFEMETLLAKIGQILTKKEEIRIILADFKEAIRTYEIRGALEQERYQVDVVEGIEELKQIIERARPDFIVMEYMQKDISGEECIKMIRETNRGLTDDRAVERKEPAIIVYSYSGMDFREKSLKAGADKYIGKPETYDDMIKAIREIQIQKKQ